MIGIIGAMEVEIELIKTFVTNLQEKTTKVRTFYTGTISGKDVVIVQAGIGKVNASITTSILIEKFNVDAIINIGVAGGQNGVEHKDVVISTEVLYHDVDVTNFGSYVHGQMPGHDATFIADKNLLTKTIGILDKYDFSYRVGKIASGDQFVYNKETVNKINQLYTDIFAIEMEAAAIGHTASIYGIPFIVYRSISDVIDDENQAEDFNSFVRDASNNAAKVLIDLLQVI